MDIFISRGALDAESVNGLDDVLRIASNLGQYEFIEGVTSDKELGGWLVEHGQAGVEFPEAVRPYLDYAGIGAEHYASHGGAYTPSGYVKRRMVEQEQAVEPKSKFSLTLTSPTGSICLDLPAFQDDLDQAKRVLDLDSLDSAAIVDVEIGYPWADLLRAPGETQRSGFAGERSRSGTSELWPQAEVRDVGLAATKQDGVRENSYGSVKRLSAPWPQQTEQGQTMY